MSFDSAAVLNQLGISGKSSSTGDESGRGIMKLRQEQNWVCAPSSSLDFTFGLSNRAIRQINRKESMNYFPHTYGLCFGCGREMELEEAVVNGDEREGVGGATKIDGVLARIFMDAIKREGVGPAKALQSLFWVLNAEQYYRRFPYFEKNGYHTAMSFFEEHAFPLRRDGLLVVCWVSGAHFLVVFLAMLVFLRGIIHRRRNQMRLGLRINRGGGKFMDGLKSVEVRVAMALQALFWALKEVHYSRWTLFPWFSGLSISKHYSISLINGLRPISVMLGVYFLAVLVVIAAWFTLVKLRKSRVQL